MPSPTSPAAAQARCPHGTPETPCCAACAVVDAAEAVLVDVQKDMQQAVPRSELELWVFETLQAFAPVPVTAMQIAQMLGLSRERVRTVLVALAMLETIEHFSKGGYYRAKGTRAEPSTPALPQ